MEMGGICAKIGFLKRKGGNWAKKQEKGQTRDFLLHYKQANQALQGKHTNID
jgi:hypothetical protein